MLDSSAVNEEQLIYLRQKYLAHACEPRSQSRAHFHASRGASEPMACCPGFSVSPCRDLQCAWRPSSSNGAGIRFRGQLQKHMWGKVQTAVSDHPHVSDIDIIRRKT